MEHSPEPLLLSTKIKMPAPRRDYVVRKALFDKLSRSAELSVVFIRGGAGTGKTTLLSSFIRETKLKNVGWLSLDPAIVNVYSFWVYFTAAVNTYLGDDEGLLQLLRSNLDASHTENLLIMLINRLCGDEDYYLVLDDVHTMTDPALLRTFEFFLGAMPENFHLFMLSREDPPVYLGPLAVSGRLLYIDGKQMQLSQEEGMTFLRQTLRLGGSEEQLRNLNEYAEGWVGGLQLAAAAESAGKDPRDLLRAGGGIAAEYLTREIFEALTDRERDFLLSTGFLSYFDAEICTTLIENFDKNDFDAMIEALTGKNLFIICIDESKGVYRYHNILSEYLTHQLAGLPDEERRALLKKAASAYEACDKEEALRQYCAAGDYGSLMRVARGMGGGMEAWSTLDKVPDDLIIADADLAAQSFLYNLGNMNIERCRSLYDQFKEHYGDTDVFNAIRFADAYVLKNDNVLPEYHFIGAEQLDALHFGDVAKAMILIENSIALLNMLEYERAEKTIDKAYQICAGSNAFVGFFAYNQRAQLYEELGRFNESFDCYERSLKMFHSPQMTPGLGTNYYIGITGLYMQRMELDKAQETLNKAQQVMEELRIHVDVADMTLVYHQAEMKFLRGDAKAGLSLVEGILAEYPNFSVLTLGRLLHELDCAGLLSARLADTFLHELEGSGSYSIAPFMRLLRARLLFERGETAQAFKETESVLAFSREHKNRLRLVNAGLLKVLMLLKGPEMAATKREVSNLLLEAVYYAHSERIFMPFYLDRGVLLLPLQGLLNGKSPLDAAQSAFVREAIELCGGKAETPKEPEILSGRELEVLGELAGGITNREIAARLCISQATVKTHVLSIFGKLGVSSRVAAVNAGRERGIIK